MANDAKLDVRVVAHDEVSKTVKGIESSIIRFVGAVSASLAAISVVVFPVTQAKDFERAMKDVQKTTGFTDDEISELSGTMLELSANMSVTAIELAKIAAIGGQLGLGTFGVRGIEQFTESIARAKVTLGLTEEQVGSLGAQITQIFSIPTSDIERVISVINELSNTSVATANELGDIVKRVGDIAGLTFQQAAALAAFTRDLGVTSEVAGTALSKAFANMQSKSVKFAKIMNESQEDWINRLNKDALKALTDVSREINKLGTTARASAIGELFGQGRQFSLFSKIIGTAATNFELLSRHSQSANSAFEEGTSSINEYNSVMDSLTEQTGVLGNTLSALSIAVGNKFLPQVREYVAAFIEFFQADTTKTFFIEFGESIQNSLDQIGVFVGWVSDLNIEWTNLLTALELFIKLQLAKVILSAAFGLSAMAANLFTVGRSWGSLSSFILTYVLNIRAADRANLAFAASANAATAAVGGGALAAAFAGLRNVIAGIVLQWQLFVQGMRSAAAAGALSTATTSATDFVASIGAATAATTFSVKSLLGLLGTLALRVVSLLAGPLGLVLILGLTFSEQIADMLGFSDKATKAAERDLKTRQRQQQEQLKKAASEYKALLARGIDAVTVEVNLDFDATSYLADLNKLAKAFREVSAAARGLDNGDQIAQALDRGISAQKSRLEAAKAELEELRKDIAKPFSTAGTAGSKFAGSSLAEVGEGQEEQAAALEKTIQALEESIAGMEESVTNVSTTQAGIRKALSKLTDEVANSATEEFDIFTKLSLQLATINKDISSSEDALARLNTSIGLIDEQEEPEQFKQMQETIDIAAARLVGFRNDSVTVAKQLDDAYGNLAPTFEKVAVMMREVAAGGGVSTLRAVSEANDRVRASNDGLLLSQGAINDRLEDAIIQYARVAVGAKFMAQTFDDSRDAARSLAKSIVGTFDNLQKSIRSSKQSLVDFGKELDKVAAENKIQDGLDKANFKIDKQSERRIESITKRYDRLISRIDDSTTRGAKRIEALEKRRDTEIDREGQRAESNKQEKIANSLTEQANKSIAEQNRLRGELVKASQELFKNEFTSSVKREEALIRSRKLQDEYKAAVAETEEAVKSVFEFNEKKFSLFSDDPQFATNILTDADKKKIKQDFEEAAGSGIEAQASLIVSQKDIAEEVLKVQTALVGPTQAAKDNAQATLDTYSKLFPEISRVNTELTKAFNQQLKSASELRKTISDAATNADIPLPLPTAEEWDKFYRSGGEGLEGVLSQVFNTFEVPPLVLSTITLKDKKTAQNSLQEEFSGFDLKAGLDIDVEKELNKGENKVVDVDLQIDKVLGLDKINVTAGAARNFAQGGHVRGPGTGTSDSIAAWLSNGEYVMDSLSTRFFGPNFFKNLQSIARGGAGKLQMPKFATGGLVGASSLLPKTGVLDSVINSTGSGTPSEVVELILTDPATGAPTSRLRGSRSSVDEMVKVFKSYRRR